MANIGATTAFYKVETSLTRANSEVSKSMERLATGKANANAGDRSSYVAMADTFRLDFVGTKAGIKGASVVMGYLETGMRVLDSASGLLSRLQELAVLGANDTNTEADSTAIDAEAEAIADEFHRLMSTSTYKGKDVFATAANSEYVSMGGRDAEMTFGLGRVRYQEMYIHGDDGAGDYTDFEAEIYILSKEEGGRHTPFFKGYRPQFYFRTTDVTGACELPDGTEMVMPGDNIKMSVELISPIAMEEGLRFAIREGGKTVGAGVVAKIIK